MRRLPPLAALALCAALCSSSAARAEGSLVTVVRAVGAGERVEESTTRLAAELRAAGFEVRLVSPDEAPDDARSLATLAVVATERGAIVDVRVADRVRRVEAGETSDDNSSSDLAIRTVELLRASLLEERTTPRPKAIPPAPAPPHAAPRPTPTSPAPVPQAPSTPSPVTVELGLGVLTGGGFGPAPTPLLRIGVGLGAGLSLRGALAPGVAVTTLTAPAGSLSLRQTAGTIDLVYAFRAESAIVHPIVALGAGIYELHVEGEATPPFQSKTGDLVAAAIVAGAGLGVRITPRFTATAELEALALTPRPVVAVLDKEVGRAGLPMILPSIGLSARF